MLGKLNSLTVLFAVIALSIISLPAMAQTPGKSTQGQSMFERRTPGGPKKAVVAVSRYGGLQFAGSKEKVIAAMQRALDRGREPGAIRDISIQSFEKVSYLAVRIEKQGTLYLQLEPSNGGIQGIFYVGDAKYLYCSGGCTSCVLFMTGPVTANGPGGPHCECDNTTNQGPGSDCKLKPRLYVNQLAQEFNGELLAIGFESTDGGSSTTGGPEVIKGTTPRRVDPIKRPNN